MTNHEPYHRQWVPHFNLKYNDIKNCQAALQIDDFTSRVCRLHHQARDLRNRNDSYDPLNP
jgi:hypothetical protein